MIGRRAVVLAGVCAASGQVAAGLPVPPNCSLAFRLIRFGSDIGRHTVAFDRQANNLTVTVAVNALVTLLSVPIVRYSHNVVETWQDGKLISVTGETNKNGRQEWVSARRTNEGLVVLGSKTTRYVAPEPAGCTSYWDRRVLDGPMISLEDGVLLRPKVAERSVDTIPLASGATIAARHYNLSGVFSADLWYDQTDTWAGFAVTAADGSRVHYERL